MISWFGYTVGFRTYVSISHCSQGRQSKIDTSHIQWKSAIILHIVPEDPGIRPKIIHFRLIIPQTPHEMNQNRHRKQQGYQSHDSWVEFKILHDKGIIGEESENLCNFGYFYQTVESRHPGKSHQMQPPSAITVDERVSNVIEGHARYQIDREPAPHVVVYDFLWLPNQDSLLVIIRTEHVEKKVDPKKDVDHQLKHHPRVRPIVVVEIEEHQHVGHQGRGIK